MGSVGDYYHTFTLKISGRDKRNAILKIKSATKFYNNTNISESLLYQQEDRYFGPKVIQNYETDDSYVREYFQPSGKNGYAPTFRRIIVSKSSNELTFDDIDE